MCFHSKCTVFSLFIYWHGLRMEGLLKIMEGIMPPPTLGVLPCCEAKGFYKLFESMLILYLS